MKHALICIVLGCALLGTACSSVNKTRSSAGNTVESGESTSKIKTSADMPATEAIRGSWINRRYLDRLADVRSPYAAKEEIAKRNPISTIVIPAFSTSTIVPVVTAFTENLKGEITSQSGNSVGSLATTFTLPGVSKIDIALSPEGELILWGYNEAGQEIKQLSFVRTNAVKDADLLLEQTVNDLLLVGRYQLEDANGTKIAEITLNKDFTVTGYEEVQSYGIETAFYEGSPSFDCVYIQNQPYNYSFNGDNIEIRMVRFDESTQLSTIGELIFILKRLM